MCEYLQLTSVSSCSHIEVVMYPWQQPRLANYHAGVRLQSRNIKRLLFISVIKFSFSHSERFKLHSFGCNSVLRNLEDSHNMANRRLRYHVKEIFKRADAVCFDVDSTLIRDEGIDRLAESCGVGEEVEAL